MKNNRVGLGFDIHRFARKKKKLILGGAEIFEGPGLEAVSDGDVALHAISDGLCGACLLGDIGDYFSPCSKECRGIDSRKIVKFILKKINKKYKIVNIDLTIIAEKPRLLSYKKSIINSLKQVFFTSCINVKIKSKEGLSVLGGKNAIACLAVVLVEKL